MRQTTFILVVFGSFLGSTLFAETNFVAYVQPPRTRLEAMELRTSTVLVKATSPMGSIGATGGTLSIICKEDRDVGADVREYGLAIGFTAPNQPEQVVLIDYDELDGLLKAADYLNKVDWNITTLGSFGASFESKAGFRLVAFSSHRSGAIELAVRNTNSPALSFRLGRDQLSQFRDLIEQSKIKIEALMKG